MFGILSILLILSIGCSRGNERNDSVENLPKQKQILILRNSSRSGDIINQQILQGVEKVKTEIDHVRIEISKKPTDLEDMKNILNDFAREGGEFVIGTDPFYYQQLFEASKEYPNMKFAIIDGEIYDIEENGNMVSYIYEPYQMGYLMGFISGKLSESGKIAFIGGFKDDIRIELEQGFIRGINMPQRYLNRRIQYVGPTREGFSSPEFAYTIANRNYLEGFDIIAHSAGESDRGIFEAAVKNQKYVIGYGVDQSLEVGDYEKRIFYSSVIKKYDIGIELSIFNFLSEFQGGNYYLDLRHQAIDYVISSDDIRMEALIKELEELKKKLNEGY